MTKELPFAEACERNKEPILGELRHVLPGRGHVLEVGSGTGQHVVHFAPAFPRLSWQPTECASNLEGLNPRIRQRGCANLLPAIELDVESAWPDHLYAAAYSSNTAHIMPWRAVSAMFAGIGTRLGQGGVFCLYGPFNTGGGFTSASNEEFDRQLRARDPAMGLRDIEDLEALAQRHQLKLEQQQQLPANNRMLVFRALGVE